MPKTAPKNFKFAPCNLKGGFDKSKVCQLTSWLVCRRNPGGHWRIGCNACSALSVAVDEGRVKVVRHLSAHNRKAYHEFGIREIPKIGRLRKHEASGFHKLAMRYMKSGATKVCKEYIAIASPSKDVFEKLYRHIRKRGKSSEIDGIGGHRKIRRLLWCLAEAKRARSRRVLATASTIAVHQDKGQGFLHTRFTACGDKFSKVSGVIGLTQMVGGHREIILSTDEVLQRFCSPGSFRPRNEAELAARRNAGRHPPEEVGPILDAALYDIIREKVHLFNADGASDCQLAGTVMQQSASTRSMRCQGSDVFPNLGVVNWDAAHASRRLTSRPWATDDYLKDTLTMFIGQGGMVRMIQNSSVFTQMYRENLAKMPNKVGPNVKDLCFAAHRFDSTTKPLGRGVHSMYPVLQTAMQIVKLRSGTDEASSAKAFLRQMSTERVVQLALIADAAHEAMRLTRLTDSEGCKTEMLGWELEAFMSKVTMLYVDKHISKHGFTKWILEQLSTPLVVSVDQQV